MQSLIRFACAAFLTLAATPLALAQGAPDSGAAPAAQGEWRHATSLIGEPKYKPDFKRFSYVNPDAPKGGTVRLASSAPFDTLNPILPKGATAPGLGYVYEPLMASAMDEVSTEYGLIAEALRYPDDFSSVTFRLNPAAKWQDGQPVTPEDVVWSFNEAVKLDPSQRLYYHHVTKAEKTGDHEVTFTFDEKGNRELPNIMAQLLVLPQHWWEGTDSSGKKRDIANGTLEPVMGSGPYRVASVDAGKTIVYQRVADYWGANLPVRIGTNNFDQIRYDTYLDDNVEFEGFKGDLYDWRDENMAKRWATAYGFPAVQKKAVLKELFPNALRSQGVMVGFVPNLRRPIFADRRVRQAINYAFDFETLNRTLFYGQYERVNSFFYGTPLASSGIPQGQELDVLSPFRNELSREIYTNPYQNPVGGDPEKERGNLRKALELLQGAGYKLNGQKLVDGKTGQQLSFELLLNGPTIEPVALSLQAELRKIGVDMRVRSVDTSQYINRIRSRDFDMIYSGWPKSLSPGNEQRDFWGSSSADQPSSRNFAGIKDPVVDKLIEDLVQAKDRDTLIATTHALDRVLLWNQYVIPSYSLRQQRIARWDRFGHPEILPQYDVGFPSIWWWDQAKADVVQKAKQ
ncbi:microcin C transport system substrate-binding protein [Faunimonas pinastri]|uniref:Microcin C transport system substrate-binding protein n=1 Tax=Faunimonas pinastri TaxID=1855383 RepID=A0A1H9HEI2_9HYPH|nr:extracellular solute-binding protein [Faunimonas pinastri]SEQ60740.1 microcin C transport system substrate-binding protein [Faunimonas pinastri]